MRYVYLVAITASWLVMSLTNSCQPNQDQPTEGEKLARIHCVSCHAFAEPSLLDKNTWSQGVLPRMAELMYVDKYYDPYNINGPQGDMPDSRAAPESLFPYEKWEKIVKYYLANAPAARPTRAKELSPVKTELKSFLVHEIGGAEQKPVTTLVRFDTTNHLTYFGDGESRKLIILDKRLARKDSLAIAKGIADIHFSKKSIDLISMGIMRPSDAKLGQINRYQNGSVDLIIDSLQRPVHASYGDLNNDGQEDIVLCEFGYRFGALSWLENSGKKYLKHILRALPGAINTVVKDMNHDGLPDIIALMSQGNEGIFIYYNQGNNRFREEQVLSFPPVYGSNGMQLCDLNGDGSPDIVTTNGDNADFSIVFKPYHGIRLFFNDGKNQFREESFLPVHGVQKAVAEDMDNDGDLDIVSLAFFPDFEKLPSESFIYWENIGKGAYARYTFPGVTNGRWMTMDVGDMEGDGDKDIILGSGVVGFGVVPDSLKERWNRNSVSVVILENILYTKNR
jgi:hypothetical protein